LRADVPVGSGGQRENSIKAIVRETYGSPDILELRDIDIPEIGAPNLEAGDARKSVFGSLHILTSGLAGRKLSALNTSSR
jgi:hypothetical protein